MIALACRGTAWLHSADGSAPPFDASSSTFQFVHTVEFAFDELHEPGSPARPPLDDVADWLQQLRRDGTTRLWLVIPQQTGQMLDDDVVDAHLLVAFAGAG